MTIDCTTDGFKSHVIPMPMNKKRASKNHQMYSKSVRKICKKDV